MVYEQTASGATVKCNRRHRHHGSGHHLRPLAVAAARIAVVIIAASNIPSAQSDNIRSRRLMTPIRCMVTVGFVGVVALCDWPQRDRQKHVVDVDRDRR
jgi:hypothetical protein